MKVTSITVQKRDTNRVNVMMDGKFRLSLDIAQVGELKIKIGKEYDESELAELETEGQFGKLYARTLEYCLLRPHSSRELRDYLYRKTRSTVVKGRKTGELRERPGVSKEIADRVFDRLVERGHIDDEKFARFWVENRNVRKGMSKRKLHAELIAKGVDAAVIEQFLAQSQRTDNDELRKIIAKKRARYTDDRKFMQYLSRQGFTYDDIKSALDVTLSQ